MNDSTPLVFFKFFFLVFPNFVSKYEWGLTSEVDKTKQNKTNPAGGSVGCVLELILPWADRVTEGQLSLPPSFILLT